MVDVQLDSVAVTPFLAFLVGLLLRFGLRHKLMTMKGHDSVLSALPKDCGRQVRS